MAKKNKIVVICFGFEKKTLRSQPWYSVNKICDSYNSKKNELFIISDGKEKFVNHHKIINLKKIFKFNSPTNELRKVISFIKPKKIIVIVGSQSFLTPGRFSEFKNLSFLIGNNRFNFKEISRISFLDFFREFKLLKIPVLSSLIPGFLIAMGFKLTGSSNIIYLSKEAQFRYHKIGLPRGKVFIPFNKIKCKKNKFKINNIKKIFLTYFGPAISSRGLDIVFNVFEELAKKKKNLYLNLLIRFKNEPTLNVNMIDLKNKVKNSKFSKNIILDTKYYSATSLQKKIKESSINILPFKITISDTPLVINDATKTKIPLFILDTAGVSEHAINTNTYICDNEEDIIHNMKRFLYLK